MRLDPRLQELQRLAWTSCSLDLELLAALLVVRNEKCLQLIKQGLAHIIDGFQVLMVVRVDGDTQQPVVAFGLALLGLLRLDDSNNTDLDQASYMGRRVQQDKDVQRIAVFTKRGGNEAEVERKHHPFG